jgi:integrase
MKIDENSSAKVIQRNGISVRIRPTSKNGVTRFVLDYRNQGQRKLVWRSSMEDARKAANDAIDKITEGQGEVLNLKSSDAHAYTRSRAALKGAEGETKIEKEIDEVVREYADAYRLLAGRATIMEACRDWLKRHAVELPKITVAAAVEQFKKQAVTDKKSKDRKKQFNAHLTPFATKFNQDVETISPDLVSSYLLALPFVEKTKSNHRDTISFFNRWLIMRGFLPKGTDWLEGVQKYSKRKFGEIHTYTPGEMGRLIAAANDKILPLIVIGGFAGLRHAEIMRLEWQDIDLEDGFIEVKAINAKTDMRRIVPLKDNLKKFLKPLAKESGKVVAVGNSSNELLKVAAATGNDEKEIEPLKWKHNALRHTYISARVAECGDVPRVADEAGNSPQVIRSNYLKRMRPAAAAEWFAIEPEAKK